MTSFEWLVEPTVLARALAAAGVASSTLAIDVGCGASDLARALREELKCPHVLAVDVDATLVAARADESCVCDVSDPDQTAVAPGSADLVVDKSSLDCLLCSDRAESYARGVHRMLAPGGRWAVLSFRGEAELRRYLGSCDGWRWDGCTAVPRAQGGDVHLVVLTRREGDVVLRDAAPPPRSPKSAVAAHAWPRTVDAAHAALFPELCGEYPLDEFRRDLAAYFKGDCPAELSAEDAEGFLRVMG